MSFQVLAQFYFRQGVRVELIADNDSPRLVCRLGIPEGLYPSQTQEEAIPLGNALMLRDQLERWVRWHEQCHRCGHPRREHFEAWAGDLTLTGCAHGAQVGFDVRALPCGCMGIDR